MFDRDYAARLVLGVHGRGASDADVKLFADALADNLMQRYGSSLLDFNTKLQVRVKSETPLPRRPRRQGLQRDAAPGRRADPGRLPDAQGRRPVEGVRRDGRRHVASCRPSATSSTPRCSRSRSAQVAADLRAGKLQADAQQLNDAAHASRRDGDALVFAGALDRAAVAGAVAQSAQQLRPACARIRPERSRAASTAPGWRCWPNCAARARQAQSRIDGDAAGLAELRAAYRLDDRRWPSPR